MGVCARACARQCVCTRGSVRCVCVCVCVHVYIYVYAWAAVRAHLGAPEIKELLEPRSVQGEFRASKQLPNRYAKLCVCVCIGIYMCLCVYIHKYVPTHTHTHNVPRYFLPWESKYEDGFRA